MSYAEQSSGEEKVLTVYLVPAKPTKEPCFLASPLVVAAKSPSMPINTMSLSPVSFQVHSTKLSQKDELSLNYSPRVPCFRVHFALDIWSSDGGQHAYLPLTGHWWDMQESVKVAKSSTPVAANNLEALEVMMGSWPEGEDTIFTKGSIVTDRGTNMLKVVCDSGFKASTVLPTSYTLLSGIPYASGNRVFTSLTHPRGH